VFDGDAASHTPPDPNVGENNPDPNWNEDDTLLSPRGERLMKRLSIFVQQTFEQFKHDTGNGKEKVLGDSSKAKSDGSRLKTFVVAALLNSLDSPIQ